MPIDVFLHIMKERLEKDRTLKKRTNLSVTDIFQLITIVAISTYFQYKNTTYKQKEDFAMGDPLSAIMSNFFMEDLEEKAITPAAEDYKPTLWKHYLDDILEKIQHTQELMDHLNTTDKTGNIKFTRKKDKGTITFLDKNIHHKQDGSIKTTDQY